MTKPLEYLNEKARCPDCDSPYFIIGPEGGMASNIKCAGCGQCFWFGPPFTPTRIENAGAWAYTRRPVNLWDEFYGMIVPPARRLTLLGRIRGWFFRG
jgi:hypothetical protein